jgi:S1-C subfamily serine protease
MPTDATGVVVTDVKDGTPAAQFGFQPQDIIVAVNGEPMKSVKDLDAAVGSHPRMWSFDVNRGGQLLRQIIR